MKENSKYKHDDVIHNLESPRSIVPILIQLVSPASVLDVGCGTGTFLKVFKENGVKEVHGIDGSWVNRKLLFDNILESEFSSVDLEQVHLFPVSKKYDLAVCLEVAEHLSESRANELVQYLTKVSDNILFSAAIPFQGGQNHVNEQWPSYWVEKFGLVGFDFFDVIRPEIWNSANVQYWYKQNTFLAVKRGSRLSGNQINNRWISQQSMVHPDLYLKKAEQLDKITHGRAKLSLYLKLLLKWVLSTLRVY